MAIDLTLKGVEITNREATPRVLNNPGRGSGAREKVATGFIASVTAALSITSVIRLVEVPSNAIVTDVRITSGAQTAGAFDVGVYRNNRDGGAVVDADLFASAVSCAAAVVNVDILNESLNNSGTNQVKPLWQLAGLTSDPKTTLDICCTVATTDVTTGASYLGLRVRYCD